MNKSLFIARKARGFSAKEAADALNLKEEEYSELEAGIVNVSADVGLKLSELYGVSPGHFMLASTPDYARQISALEKMQEQALLSPIPQAPADLYLQFAKLNIDLLSTREKLRTTLEELSESLKDNLTLRNLYTHLKAQQHPGQDEILP